MSLPDNHDFVSRFKAFQTQFTYDFAGFVYVDERLAVSCGEELLPTFGRRVGRFPQIVAPLGDVVVAHGFFFLFFVGNREDEMHVGMHEGVHLPT